MADPGRYPVPAAQVQVEDVISHSRFITTLTPAGSVDAAREFITAMRAGHAGATHNCWAYLIGPPASTAHVGLSDDGEPHGTAGRPMLNVLLHSGAGDLAVVVTRYYGGIKLGKGGLVRAYAGGVKHALDDVELAERITWETLSIELDYAQLETCKRFYPEFEVEILSEEFTAQVHHSLRLPTERTAAFTAALTDRFSGRIIIR